MAQYGVRSPPKIHGLTERVENVQRASPRSNKKVEFKDFQKLKDKCKNVVQGCEL